MVEVLAKAFQSLDANSVLAQKAKNSGTFEERKNNARRAVIGGRQFFVVEGDLLLDEVQLARYALQKDAGGDEPVAETEVGGKKARLVGIGRDGKLVRWKPGVVLSYYVAHETFRTENEYQIARESVRTAADEWMEECGITFEYRNNLDKNPAQRPGGSLFGVSFVDTGGALIAAAFFPDDPPDRRLVVIDPSFYSPDLLFDRVGVLRHELGHVLGFRHEHIRSEAPAVCPGEPTFDTINLTRYDPRSVMHYFCGDVGDKELKITDVDREGAQRLYGLPFSTFHFVE
jgi:hypothetical protein